MEGCRLEILGKKVLNAAAGIASKNDIISRILKILFTMNIKISEYCLKRVCFRGVFKNSIKISQYFLNSIIIDTSPYESIAGIENEDSEKRDKQLFLDITETLRNDEKTGIQRVARGFSYSLLTNPPKGIDVVPIYFSDDTNYYMAANCFRCKILSLPKAADAPIQFFKGDIYLGMDINPQIYKIIPLVMQMRTKGVHVRYMLPDILRTRRPEWFEGFLSNWFNNWLLNVALGDGVICISKAVSDDFADWLKVNKPKLMGKFAVDFLHIGSDIQNAMPTRGMPDDAPKILDLLKHRISFLMVGTIEPRKGHEQVLDAFGCLWDKGVDVNLVIVGKVGWDVEKLLGKIKKHFELNKRLIWLDSISDEFLDKIYENSTCLIAASFGEGFGLPLIEAAKHKLPIIARDIPVFKEVAGEHACYFSDDLAVTVESWLNLYGTGAYPKSDNMAHLTWEESSRCLMRILLGKNA